MPYFESMSIEAEIRSLAFGLGPEDRLNLDDTDAEEEEVSSAGR